MLRLLLVKVRGATFQTLTKITYITSQAQNLERPIAVSLAFSKVAQVGDKQRVRIALKMPSCPQAKNTLASCLAI